MAEKIDMSSDDIKTDIIISVGSGGPKKSAVKSGQRSKTKSAEKEKKALELQQKRESIEREKLERQRIRDNEKEKRDREKRHKEEQRQRIKHQKERERLDRLQTKEAEKLKKQEERDAILEKRRQIEEEKQRKHDLKVKEEEEKNRKLAKSQDFFKRFVKKGLDDSIRPAKNGSTDMKSQTNGPFLPFQLSANQTIAPIVHDSVKERFVLGTFDATIESQDSKQLYLDSLKNADYEPFKFIKPEIPEPEIVCEDNFNENNKDKIYKVKHLQFHTNVRPPYRGTWRKSSHDITGRTPFSKDCQHLDYELDSDEEWEEGGPGDVCGSDSEDSVKDMSKDDYEIDNEFFVPHGYLSEDENDDENQLNSSNVSNDNDIEMTEESEEKENKSGPLLKEQVLMAERNRKFAKTLIPVLIGCVWESNADQNNRKAVEILRQFKRTAIQYK